MNRLLARTGVGAAEVDVAPATRSVAPGETIDIELALRGGRAEQRIAGVGVALHTATEDGETLTLREGTVSEDTTLGAGEERRYSATITLPRHTPSTTVGESRVWITGRPEIPWAVAPTNEVSLDVAIDPAIQATFEALDRLAFRFAAESVHGRSDIPGPIAGPFGQVFTFRPRAAPFAGDVGRLSIVPRLGGDDDAVTVIVTGTEGTGPEHAGPGKRHASVAIPDPDPDRLVDPLRRTIRETIV